jgi:LCP family protein required for cell wall assembly
MWALLGAVLALLLPVFLVGVGMVLYLIFPPQPTNILLLGMDARDGEGFLTRTDSIMLIHIEPGSMDASLMSIPRDLYIQTPGYGLQRINTINVLGEQDDPGNGAALVVTAVGDSFNIEVDHYMRVNFDSFTAIIDALGGIDVEVPSLLIDYQYPTDDYGTTTLRFEPGWQHMDGERALAYARTRHADDDYRRAARQQQVLTAIARTLFNPLNWPRVPGALIAFGDAVDTDMNLIDLALIAPPLVLDGTGGQIDRLVIERDMILRSPEGYAIPDYAGLAAWLDDNLR